MSSEIIVALITLGGSGLGSLTGIIISSRLTNYRLKQIEKKVDEHNHLVHRMYKLEGRQDLVEDKVKKLEGRV